MAAAAGKPEAPVSREWRGGGAPSQAGADRGAPGFTPAGVLAYSGWGGSEPRPGSRGW